MIWKIGKNANIGVYWKKAKTIFILDIKRNTVLYKNDYSTIFQKKKEKTIAFGPKP